MRGPGLASWMLGAALLAGGVARADQHDPALPGLFEALRTAPDAETAGPIEARIWAAWLRTDDAAARDRLAEGVTLMSEGRLAEALAAFDALVTAAPDFAEGWNKRATVRYMLGQIDGSIADIDRVLALEPRHFGALSGLGLCEARRGRDRAALAAFERALAVDPTSPGARANADALRQALAGESI